MLKVDPEERISVEDALQHTWITSAASGVD
jgi:hypothetical protein